MRSHLLLDRCEMCIGENGMSLIEQVRNAVERGDLIEPFTVDSLKNWITQNNVVKDDGNKYAQSSIDALLSNSNLKNSPTSNNNRKVLNSEINQVGKCEYWFNSFGT